MPLCLKSRVPTRGWRLNGIPIDTNSTGKPPRPSSIRWPRHTMCSLTEIKEPTTTPFSHNNIPWKTPTPLLTAFSKSMEWWMKPRNSSSMNTSLIPWTTATEYWECLKVRLWRTSRKLIASWPCNIIPKIILGTKRPIRGSFRSMRPTTLFQMSSEGKTMTIFGSGQSNQWELTISLMISSETDGTEYRITTLSLCFKTSGQEISINWWGNKTTKAESRTEKQSSHRLYTRTITAKNQLRR